MNDVIIENLVIISVLMNKVIIKSIIMNNESPFAYLGTVYQQL